MYIYTHVLYRFQIMACVFHNARESNHGRDWDHPNLSLTQWLHRSTESIWSQCTPPLERREGEHLIVCVIVSAEFELVRI